MLKKVLEKTFAVVVVVLAAAMVSPIFFTPYLGDNCALTISGAIALSLGIYTIFVHKMGIEIGGWY